MSVDRSLPSFDRRYILHEQLGKGGMGAVYRVTDRLTGQVMALKRVTAPPEQAEDAEHAKTNNTFSLRLALAHEFQTLASLRHPRIISVLDYGFDKERQPYFTMDLLKEPQTILEAGCRRPRAEQVRLLIEILQALAYLHRRGIIHRDLKPGNVLTTDDHVKVLDFGISTQSTLDTHIPTESTSGTLAYMAPELLMGVAPGKKTDLYAVGMMAYELFAGQYPFNIENVGVLIDEILNKPIDVKSIGLPEPLSEVLKRLLSKDSIERYDDADVVIAALCAATNQPLPAETIDIRESFLQTAPFVERDAELAQMLDTLDKAMNRHGGAWLVAGESGVGKSRLIDEIRTQAQVQGMAVVRGQAVAEGGVPYQVWQEPIRWLCLLTDLDRYEASVLKSVFPDIGRVLGYVVPDASALEPQAAQNRLVSTVVNLLRRQAQPMLIILEDVQWAGSESLIMLDRIRRAAVDLPLLIVGSYRDDEHPNLFAQLPGIQVLKLNRLTETAIAKLSEAMLGPGGREPELVSFLQQETEGNVFFLVEVVRALAEQAGQLDRIASTIRPQHSLSGGVRQIVQRRLERVPAQDYPLLKLAGLMGRHLDKVVLHTLAPNVNLDRWLVTCANAAVLEAHGDEWRFSHDKMREGIRANLSEEEQRALHRQLAEAIETAYPNSLDQVAALAYQWQQADDAEKERHYAILASQQAQRNNANAEATRYLYRALELLKSSPETPERNTEELNLQLKLVAPLIATKGFGSTDVEGACSRALELCQRLGDSPQLFPVLTGLAQLYMVRGLFAIARQIAGRCLSLAQQTEDPVFYMETHRVTGAIQYWSGDFERAVTSFEKSLALYNPELHQSQALIYGQDTGAVASIYSAVALWFLGYPAKARAMAQRAIAHAESVSHLFTLGFARVVASGLSIHCRDTQAAYDQAVELIAMCNEYGFADWLANGKVYQGWALTRLGKPYEGIPLIQEGISARYANGTAVGVGLFLTLLAEACERVGFLEDGLDAVEESLTRLPTCDDHSYEADAYQLKGRLLMARSKDDWGEAEANFHKAIQVAQHQRAKSLELRAAIGLAQLWQRQGKREQAKNMLSETYSWFTEGLDTGDLLDAKVLIESLS